MCRIVMASISDDSRSHYKSRAVKMIRNQIERYNVGDVNGHFYLFTSAFDLAKRYDLRNLSYEAFSLLLSKVR